MFVLGEEHHMHLPLMLAPKSTSRQNVDEQQTKMLPSPASTGSIRHAADRGRTTTAILTATPTCDGSKSMDVYAENVAAALGRVAPDFSFLMLRPGKEHEPWHRKQYLRYRGYPQLLRNEVRRRKCGLIHILDQNASHLCHIADRAVVTCHDIADFKLTTTNPKPWGAALWKWRLAGLRRAWKISSVSRNTASDVETMLGIPSERIIVNPCGVSPLFTPSPAAALHGPARRLAQMRGTRFLFLHVGTNIPRKNIPVLLQAFSLVKREHPNATLVKVGEPFSQDGYANAVRELGISDSVLELGRISDEALVEVYRWADCLVFPSSYEGFGLPALEAQASGLPCILARSSSLEEVGGSAVLYHQPSDPSDLAARMMEVLTNGPLRSDLRDRGLSHASLFTWENHARRLLDIYSEASISTVEQRIT